VAELRKNPRDPFLGKLDLPMTIERCASVLSALDEKPIIMGHSFGGLLTQLMIQRDLGAAGVAIDSVPPLGVPSFEWSFYRSTWTLINPLIPSSRPYFMTFEDFQYKFGNDLPLEAQRAGWERDIVPESRRLSRGGIGLHARVDFKKERAPLLFIGGEKDHIMPAALNRRNARAYRKSPSITEYKEFPGRAHYSILAGPKWEEVADYALDWALRVAATPAVPLRRRATA
jgi:pimeloyl-ACP methyl ester carboxylesterase